MAWTFARIRKPEHEGIWLPDTYNTYVIKRDGVEVGVLKHVYRTKNAGGPCWRATYTGKDHPSNRVSGCVGVGYDHKNKAAALALLKQSNDRPLRVEQDPREVAYDRWARNLGDASGAGQDWDANHGFDA